MTIEELEKLHSFHGKVGALKPKVDLRDYKMTFAGAADTTPIPKTFKGTPLYKVKNQGQVGSCVAHGVSEAIEHLNVLDTGTYTEFSTGFIYGNKDDHTSEGMIIRDALKFVANNGDVFESDFPYNLEIPDIFDKLNEVGIENLLEKAQKNKKIVTYFQLNSDDDIKRAIMKYGYVVIGMEWFSDNALDYTILSDKEGDYTATLRKGTEYAGNHCVILYGWDEENWYMANSWGFDWGHNGGCLMPYTYGYDEAWGVEGATLEKQEDNPVTPIIVKPSTNAFIDFVLKLINFIINLFKKQ